MSAPMIGLCTYARDELNRFTLFADYVDSVRRAGGIAVLLPPGEARIGAWLRGIDGVVLTGGGDLDPDLYEGKRREEVYDVDAERDATELELARLVVDYRRPALCICRGQQVLNVLMGGTLIEDLPAEIGESVRHRLPPRDPTPHAVEVDADSFLAKVLGACDMEPMSWHHQAVREPAPGLRVVARAPDGVIEAMEVPDRPELLCVQWHPELTSAEDPTQQRLFDYLVERAAEFRARRAKPG